MRLPMTLFAGSLLLQAGAAHAEKAPEWSYCDAGGPGTAEVRIDNCTVLINSGQESPRSRAVAYANRGHAYSSR